MFKLIRKGSFYGLLLMGLSIAPGFAKDISTPTLEDIKILIAQEKWAEAKQSADIYRQHYPEDADGLLELGVIKNHEKNYAEVVKILEPALVKYPHYVDIRLTLINAEMGLKQPQKALSLIEDGLMLDPSNEILLKKRAGLQLENIKILIAEEKWTEAKQSADIYRQHYPEDADGLLEWGIIENHAKDYAEVIKILGPALVKYPNYLDIRLTLINAEMGLKQPQKALSLIEDGLMLDPRNEILLKKRADIQFENGDPVASAKTLQQLLSINPQNDQAKNLLTEIQNTPPEYGIGPYKVGVETWTADTKNVNQSASTEQTWYYDSLYLGANTDYGYVQLSGNYANRLGFQGTQGKLEFDPKINSYLYFELVTGYSEQEVLFPHYLVGGEGYVYIPHLLDVSLGETYRNLGATYLNTYTGSLSKSIQQYWFSFKPYYFVPSNDGPQSVLYTAKVRRYFGSPDFYVELSGGIGHSPDLPDLLAAAFIKVKNNYVQVKLNLPLDEHRYVLSVGPQYERLTYPSGTILTLWSGELDLSIRFS